MEDFCISLWYGNCNRFDWWKNKKGEMVNLRLLFTQRTIRGGDEVAWLEFKRRCPDRI